MEELQWKQGQVCPCRGCSVLFSSDPFPQDWAVYPADAVLRLASLELKAHVARAEQAEHDELSAWKEAVMAEAWTCRVAEDPVITL